MCFCGGKVRGIRAFGLWGFRLWMFSLGLGPGSKDLGLKDVKVKDLGFLWGLSLQGAWIQKKVQTASALSFMAIPSH